MSKKVHESLDLMLYSVGLALTFLMFLLSKWLSGPLMLEVETGTSLVDLVFDGNDQISFLWNLLLPTFLLFLGILTLLILLWQMGKAIVSKHDSKFNKLFLLLIAHVILIDLILAFKNGWQLLMLNLQYIGVLIVLLLILSVIIQYFVKGKKQRT